MPSGHIIFSLIFSKKIYHRQSLYHTSLDVYHRFALQIYIIVGWLIPKPNLLMGDVLSGEFML